MSLTPPLAVLFTSLDTLLANAKAHASNHGFAITILRSKRNKARVLYKVWLSVIVVESTMTEASQMRHELDIQHHDVLDACSLQ